MAERIRHEELISIADLPHWRTQGGRRLPGCSPLPHKAKLKKKTGFGDTNLLEVLLDLLFCRNQPLKSADD
jgi:hypothetical protein